jgi:DNA-binding NarL/FixJ family response regulator
MEHPIINVSILEDHQGNIDGYLFRLRDEPSLKITGIARYAIELEPMLAANPTDILIMDLEVPISRSNSELFPILQVIPKLVKKYPAMNILVISMHTQVVLIEKLVGLGVGGYIFKDDHEAIQHLSTILLVLKSGGAYFSQGAYTKLRTHKNMATTSLLTPAQLEALTLCATFPNSITSELAKHMNVSNSTFRNTLSHAYERLGVHSRRAAIAYVQKLELHETQSIKDNIPKS